MSWIVVILLIIAILAAVISSVGVLVARDVFDRLHFLGPVKILGSLGILLAVLVEEGFTQMSGKVAFVVLIILISGPVITHAIARAGVARGDASRLRGENWEVRE